MSVITSVDRKPEHTTIPETRINFAVRTGIQSSTLKLHQVFQIPKSSLCMYIQRDFDKFPYIIKCNFQTCIFGTNFVSKYRKFSGTIWKQLTLHLCSMYTEMCWTSPQRYISNGSLRKVVAGMLLNYMDFLDEPKLWSARNSLLITADEGP